jgi:dTMP kinase
MSKGRFITFEGGEGAGKSTQIKALADYLRNAGIDVVSTREPGGSPGAEEIRKLLVTGATDRWHPMTEALLHFAARKEHLEHTVHPAMATGTWVLCDRFADSTMAYQGYGHGLGEEPIDSLYRTCVGAFAPDLTLILDLPVEVGLARAGDRGASTGDDENRYERMAGGFHQRVREGFQNIAARSPERCVVIDANRTADEVTSDICSAVSRKFGLQ